MHKFFLYIYFYSLQVSGSHVHIIRRITCINAVPGICHSVYMTVWYVGPTHTPDGHTHTERYIPGVTLIQLILLMMGTWLPETRREQK